MPNSQTANSNANTAQTQTADALTPLTEQLQALSPTGHPPVDQWQPARTGAVDITIKADGSWWHEGSAFKRERLVNLFSSVLWLEEGQHYLKTPAEKLRITVEEAPFFIIALDVENAGTPQQQLIFTSSYGDVIIADEQHRLWVEENPKTAEPAPYLAVRYGMKGKLSRNVFYQLGEIMEQAPCGESTAPDTPSTASARAELEQCLFVKSQGIDFQLGTAS